MSDSAALAGRRIAIFVENDFEDIELTGPRDALVAAGATVVIVGPTAPSEFKGKKLGTVSQKNEIPEGSLDGPWEKTAEQAAGAAAQGIVKLLPPPKAVN